MSSRDEMIEALADAEHASWARWMAYLYSKALTNRHGERVIPSDLVLRWQHQIDTPYADLTEREKQSDRNEVALILPIIDASLTALLSERDAEIARLRRALEADAAFLDAAPTDDGTLAALRRRATTLRRAALAGGEGA